MTFRLPPFDRCAIAVFSLASLCLAQRDPGVRGAPAGAGDPLPGLRQNELALYFEGKHHAVGSCL